MALFIATELRGVEFGDQWDEQGWHVDPARKMVSTGIFLPHQYVYPSFSKWLMLLPAARAGLSTFLANGSDPKPIESAMNAAVEGRGYVLTARGIFIVVSALIIPWVFGAALALRRPWWEALIAAAAIGLSWEYAYHARYLANDTPLAQFAALTLFMLALFHRTRRAGWLYAAAIAAGLATSTKYTGVLLLLPVLIMSVLARRAIGIWARLPRLAVLCLVAFGAYLVTTPGTVLEPYMFLKHARTVTTLYATGHYTYTVASAAEHWKLVLEYFSLCFFSPSKIVSALVAAGLLWGGVLWLRRDRRFSLVVVAFPSLFLLLFCTKYRVVVVRNYLLLGSFAALMAARGIADVAARLPSRWLRAPFLAAFAAVAVWQSVFLIRAGESIRYPDSNRDVHDALVYVADHGQQKFRVSPKVRELAAAQHLPLPTNVTEGPADAVVFFNRKEGPNLYRWKTNDPWLTLAVFGPREVNSNWYSSWDGGRDRVLVMTMAKARSTGVPLAL